MRDNIFSFKKFLNEEENKVDYFTTLADEFGVSQETLRDLFQNDVFVNSHFSYGDPKILYKMQSWEIVPGSLNEKGCLIRLKKGITDKSYLPNGKDNKSNLNTKEYYIGRDDLLKFLTTAWTPAPAPTDQSAAGGMPPEMSPETPPAMPQ